MPRTLFSELTDVQWAAVRAAVFAGEAPADARPVIDALILRERANCPWRLLPAGLPPADRLREAWDEWQADGTWERVGEVVAAHPPERVRRGESLLRRAGRAAARAVPGGRAAVALVRPVGRAVPAGPAAWAVRRLAALVRRARRGSARAVRRLPGGGALLWPGRAVIQTAQAVARRFTPHARLPGWFRRGHRQMTAGEYERAAGSFTRVLDLDPANVPVRLRRAVAYLELGRVGEAADDCWAALSAPESTGWWVTEAHFHLSIARSQGGEPGAGAGHGFLARLAVRYGPDFARETVDGWDRPGSAAGPDEFELLADAHNDLAEAAINARTDFVAAADLYARREGVRRRYADWLAGGQAARTLYLGPDWVRNIGHMALVDFWVKMTRLGWQTWDQMVLIAPPKYTANPAYARYFDQHMRVIRADNAPPAVLHLANALGPRVASMLHPPGGPPRYFTEGMGLVQEAWERDGRGPLLALTAADRAFGRARLRELGVPDGAWFVSLHVRSSGFHKDAKGGGQTHRNADIRTYLPAIREVVRRGGWVVRLGDPSMPKLPPMPGVVDYPHSKQKSGRMDVFLCGGCRFFVGVASGISHLPTTFGVPCVLTNWLSNALPVYSRDDLFVPKLLRRAGDRRPVPFAEYLAPATRLLSYSGSELTDRGYEVVDNTPDDLRGVVAEMLDRLDGRAAGSPADDARAAAFDGLARGLGLVGFSRLGRQFAADHADLLPPTGARRAA